MEEIGVESTLVEAMKGGEKTADVQLGEPHLLRVQEGDQLSIREDFWHEGKILESLSRALQVTVTQVLYFESLEEAFAATDFQDAVPSAQDSDQAILKYREFFSKEDESEYGVVVFSFDLFANPAQ